MFSPLIERMIEQHEYPVLTQDNLDEYLASHERVVLFFTENAQRFPEANDVAIILPELVKAFNGQFSAAVVALSDQRKLQMRYGFREWPALVFLKNGAYLGAISKVQDWGDYLKEINQILASEPSKAPRAIVPISTCNSTA